MALFTFSHYVRYGKHNLSCYYYYIYIFMSHVR